VERHVYPQTVVTIKIQLSVLA